MLCEAIKRDVNIVTEFDELLQGGEELLYPRKRRYAVDNMWDYPSNKNGTVGTRIKALAP